MRVGFIGAGRMGSPMVRQLAEAGHEVRALGRTEDKRRAVAELGATPVANIAAVIERAEAVVICLFTDEQVRAVADTALLAAVPAGAVLIVHTTGSPRTVEHLRDLAPHIDVVDAPVSGGPHDIAAGQVTLFVGGTDDAVQRAQPVLAAYGSPILHV